MRLSLAPTPASASTSPKNQSAQFEAQVISVPPTKGCPLRERSLPPRSLYTIGSSRATGDAFKQAQMALDAISPTPRGFAQTHSPAQEISRSARARQPQSPSLACNYRRLRQASAHRRNSTRGTWPPLVIPYGYGPTAQPMSARLQTRSEDFPFPSTPTSAA